jgi:hypothetical protein
MTECDFFRLEYVVVIFEFVIGISKIKFLSSYFFEGINLYLNASVQFPYQSKLNK